MFLFSRSNLEIENSQLREELKKTKELLKEEYCLRNITSFLF